MSIARKPVPPQVPTAKPAPPGGKPTATAQPVETA